MIDFIQKKENQDRLQPELQAEIRFGIKNTRDQSLTPSEFKELGQMFINQDSQWQGANDAIINMRSKCAKVNDESTEALAKSVVHEVDYIYAAWEEQWAQARDYAKKALDSLSLEELKSYRGWWGYLTGDAELSINHDGNAKDRASGYFKQAAYDLPRLQWLEKLVYDGNSSTNHQDHSIDNSANRLASGNILDVLKRWGFNGPTFEKKMSEGQKWIEENGHADFHQGLEFLGKILGFEKKTLSGCGAPDCVWYLDNFSYIAFEAKSGQNSAGKIGKKDLQQANGHIDWVKAKFSLNEETPVTAVIISPRKEIEKSAKVHAKDLCCLSLDDIRGFTKKAIEVVTNIRNKLNHLGDAECEGVILKELEKENLLPQSVLKYLSQKKISAM